MEQYQVGMTWCGALEQQKVPQILPILRSNDDYFRETNLRDKNQHSCRMIELWSSSNEAPSSILLPAITLWLDDK